MRIGGRRLATVAALAAIGVLASLSISTSLALITSTASGESASFQTGTVILSSDLTNAHGQSMNSPCNLSQSPPAQVSTCLYRLTYSGSLPAWVGVMFTVTPTTFTKFTITGCPGATGGCANPQHFSTSVSGYQVVGQAPVAPGSEYTVAVTASGPIPPGKGGAVELSATSVQSDNNTNAAGTGPAAWG